MSSRTLFSSVLCGFFYSPFLFFFLFWVAFYVVFSDFFLKKKTKNTLLTCYLLKLLNKEILYIHLSAGHTDVLKCYILLRVTSSESSGKGFHVIFNINQPLSHFIGTVLQCLASDIPTWVREITFLKVCEKQGKGQRETIHFTLVLRFSTIDYCNYSTH